MSISAPPIDDWTSNSSPSVAPRGQIFRDISRPKCNIYQSTDKLTRRAFEVLGKNGIERYEDFKSYPDGWDNGVGARLSGRSTAVMETFFGVFSDFDTKPSLFLTRDGNLQLAWENSGGERIELEFYPDHIEYYIQSREEEGEIEVSTLGSIERFVNRLTGA